MDWLVHNLLEDPTKVCVGLAFALLALAAVWYETRKRAVALSMLVPPVLAGIVLLAAAMVVTDREQITASAREIARCIETGQTAQIARHLDDAFTASLHRQTLRKGQVQAVADLQRDTYRITRIELRGLAVALDGDRADMRVLTAVHGSWEGLAAGRSIAWLLRWVKTPQGWRLLRAEEPQLDVDR